MHFVGYDAIEADCVADYHTCLQVPMEYQTPCMHSSDLLYRCCSVSLCDVNARITPTEAPTTTSSSGCAKCGTTKRSGRRSCCAHGGDWFKNCGNAGDTKFDHTWAEGIQACNGFGPSVSVKTPLQVMSRDMGGTVYSLHTAKSGNDTQCHTGICTEGGMLNAGNTDSADLVGLTKVVDCMAIIMLLQTYAQCT